MNTVLIENYTFDKEAKTITFNDFEFIQIEKVVSITSAVTGVQFFYNKLPNYGGTVSTNVLTLSYSTDSPRFSNTDKLIIEYAIDNYSARVLSMLARTVTGVSGEIINYGNRGIILSSKVSSVSGTEPSITLKLQFQDGVTAEWIDIPGASTSAITATGTTILTVYPGITESANSKVSFPLPRKYRVAYTISGTTPSFTFSVAAHYIK